MRASLALRTLVGFAAVSIGSLLFENSVRAQPPQRVSESNNDAIRAECASARAVLARDSRASRLNAERVKTLRHCRESAGSVLPQAWALASADSAELQTLLAASAGIRDSRITGALEAVLNDTRKDDLVRAAAASALTTLVYDGALGFVRSSEMPGEQWAISVSLVTHLSQEDGPSLPDAALKNRLIQKFDSLAGVSARRTGFQRTVLLLAAYLRSGLTSDFGLTPQGLHFADRASALGGRIQATCRSRTGMFG